MLIKYTASLTLYGDYLRANIHVLTGIPHADLK